MKRDMELIRQIAFQVEASDQRLNSTDISVEGFSQDQVAYHCELMLESGLIVANSTTTMRSNNAEFRIHRLSSSGHDFVDSARNDTIWKKAMGSLKEKAMGGTVELLLRMLKSETLNALGFAGE